MEDKPEEKDQNQNITEPEKQPSDSSDEPIKKNIIPPKPPFKFTYSKKWVTFEVILLLIVIIAATSYSFYRNAYTPKTPPPPATPTPKLTQTPTPALNTKPNIPVENTDWKTYTNPSLNYSISYPKDWQVRESTSMGYPYITISDPIAQNIFPAEPKSFREPSSKSISITEILGTPTKTWIRYSH